MRTSIKTPIIAVLGIVAFIASSTATFAQSWPPDHSKADINGREGMLLYPMDEQQNRIESRNCVVQLAPMEALETRFTYDCEEWFLPPETGAYLCWLELNGRVSSAQTLLREADTKFQGTGFVVSHETVPGGFVSVPQKIPPGHTVRYLSLDRPGYGFSIRVPAGTASKPAPMPPGRVIAGIFSEAADQAVAHSRPLLVEAGKTTEFRIDPPREGSDLLVMLRKPSGPHAPTNAILRVRDGSRVWDADVLHDSRSWYVALWYGLPATAVTLSLEASGLALKETKIQLAPAKVTTVRQNLIKTAER